ncbi:protein of unknown function [Candidatus Methylocalor cossyra]|uniref:Uncharacterized protein n=1 Tax=Candidatus Methylocalor cossyra TaxID=3108543 RepID=A0ABM9NIU7_9GAMM
MTTPFFYVNKISNHIFKQMHPINKRQIYPLTK